jgi:signal transduction histidine kinase
MLTCFLALRGVNLLQAGVCVATGARAYRRPRVAVLLAAAAALESGWLARQTRRRGSHRELLLADASFGVAGLVAMASTLAPGDRTASMNWMLPYTVVSAGAGPLALSRTEARSVAAGLAAVYGATVSSELRAGGSAATAALANIVSYAGFSLALDLFIGMLRGFAAQVDEARAEAVERGQRLAVEAERNRQHRLLHDSVLQTLEAVAGGWDVDEGALRERASAEAARLRRALRGIEDDDRDFAGAMQQLAEEMAQLGLRVEVALAEGLVVSPQATAVLCDTAREALVNVAKHAGVRQAVLRATSNGQGVELVVRDHGAGFDPALHPAGFGLAQSVIGRAAESGGHAEIWSAPEKGTRVTVWVPL